MRKICKELPPAFTSHRCSIVCFFWTLTVKDCFLWSALTPHLQMHSSGTQIWKLPRPRQTLSQLWQLMLFGRQRPFVCVFEEDIDKGDKQTQQYGWKGWTPPGQLIIETDYKQQAVMWVATFTDGERGSSPDVKTGGASRKLPDGCQFKSSLQLSAHTDSLAKLKTNTWSIQ